MKKAIITITFFIILFFSIITSSYAIIKDTTIYVDDDNITGPWDGSHEHPYQYIQDGIDGSSDGDTIFVYSGLYFEDIVLNKSIILEGENKHITIIDGSNNINFSYGIILTSYSRLYSPMISGFTVQHFDSAIAKRAPIGGILNLIISDNIIQDNGNGIVIPTTIGGYHLGLEISNNIIKNNSRGIYISCFRDFLVKRNHIVSNEMIGIELDGGYNAKIIQNNIIHNNPDAFVKSYGSIGVLCSLFLNRWNENYWGEEYNRVKIIPGNPCNVYDWHPAQEPYNIQSGFSENWM